MAKEIHHGQLGVRPNHDNRRYGGDTGRFIVIRRSHDPVEKDFPRQRRSIYLTYHPDDGRKYNV